MKYSPTAPQWINRDRFVLSNGHACALQYCMLHLTGYDLSVDDLKQFRQLDSRTPGHPENFATPGIEVATGPLGQGISNAVGLAIASAHLAATFNTPEFPIIDNFTYVICGDGCLQEGVSSEACSLAGHLGLGNLIVLYDDNQITIDGSTSLSFTEDVKMRYEAYGWHTQVVADGDNNPAAIKEAVEAAKLVTDKPSMIKINTTIGYGCDKAGSHKIHGAPLGAEGIAKMKSEMGFDPEKSYEVPEDVKAHFAKYQGKGHADAWDAMFLQYKAKHPDMAAQFERRIAGELPEGWEASLPRNTPEEPDKYPKKATRQTSEIVLNALAEMLPELMGGSADLTPSNLTALKCSGDFQKPAPAEEEPAAKKMKTEGSYAGRYLRFGVREHAMGSICNGMAAYGGIIPFCATFLNFVGYQLGAVRISALSRFRVLYVMTHDSIGLGEDGPTHQPVEMLETLRSMPNMTVMRPADMNEVCGAYLAAVKNSSGPTVMALSRQALPNLPLSTPELVASGAYTCTPVEGKPDLIFVATGSEVSLCNDAAAKMAGKKVAVVSMPCQQLFERESVEYKASVFPDGVPVMSVEAAATSGWDRFSHVQFGMTTFGCSANGGDCFKKFGFTADNIAAQGAKVIDFYADKTPHSLTNRCIVTPDIAGH